MPDKQSENQVWIR